MPKAPINAAPSKANTAIQTIEKASGGAYSSVTAYTPNPTSKPRTTDAPTYAQYQCQCDKGVSCKNTRLPMILLCTRLEALLANAFCSTLIMTSPGTKKAI